MGSDQTSKYYSLIEEQRTIRKLSPKTTFNSVC